MLNLVLLDPFPVIQRGFKTFFKKNDNISVSGTFSKTSELFKFLNKSVVNIVFLEMFLDEGGIQKTILKIKKKYPDISIIIFTSAPESKYEISLLKAGALGYISKHLKRNTLIKVINKVANSGYRITSNFINQENDDLICLKAKKKIKALSTREIQVLKHILNGKRNSQIAIRLKINQKTVNTYKSRMMKKLEVKNVVDLYQEARNNDLI